MTRDIATTTKEVSVQLDKDQLQTAWGIWRHYRSSIATDGCHGLPSRMKTNKFAATDPSRWQASEVAKSQGEGAQTWHKYRYAVGHHLRKHPLSPWDEAAADAVETAIKLPHAADAQVPDADLNAPFAQEELCSNIRRLLSDKATGPDSISNRMIQLGGDQFLKLLFLHLSDVWRESTYPDQWASSLMQPLYKGDGKDREDPASYRGIFLSNAMLKLFEGILESRLQVFTEKFDTLTPSQQGSRPGRQRHDEIYRLLAAIQQQKQSPQKSIQGATPSLGASYCGFVDFTTAYPSVHREKLQMILKESGITGKMWELLKENSRKMRIRVLHPLITARNEVEVLRGLPEGSRLSPTLFAIFAADLIREQQVKFPEITMPR